MKILSSIVRWFGGLLLQIPVDLLAYVVVPLAVGKSKRNPSNGRVELPAWASWYDDPSPCGNEGELFWRKKHEGGSLIRQMRGWLLRNKAYRFRITYVDPEIVLPTYRVWGDQYIDKSTGRTGWFFATATDRHTGRLYWNFGAVVHLWGPYAWQPYVGWGLKRARPVELWERWVTADHSASLFRFTKGFKNAR